MPPRTMTEQAFFILAALIDAPRHGYGIVGEVARLSEDRVTLKIGTLYGVLERLVTEGLVELDREEAHDGRLRRYFRLTDDGFDALDAEVARQEANARAAAGKLAAHRPAPSSAAKPASRPARVLPQTYAWSPRRPLTLRGGA